MSYVFLDLETTGLPSEENNRTKIVEISLVAVKRRHLLDTRAGAAPRVQQKLTLCLYPGRAIHPGCTEVTGLCNFLVEHEAVFNMDVFVMLNSFIKVLAKPVCLIAQNGLNFDYPILKRQLIKLGASLPDDLMCADSYHAFYDILEERKRLLVSKPVLDPEQRNSNIKIECSSSDLTDFKNRSIFEIPTNMLKEEPQKLCNSDIKVETNVDGLELMFETPMDMKAVNETTPKRCPRNEASQSIKHIHERSKARRKFPWSRGNAPKESYKLGNIYKRLLNRPSPEAHRAENDCIMTLECAVALGKEFVEWVDNNQVPFLDIRPMTVGVPLGLLVLTGLLWGCTNPFIRQGTKGLRDVHATSKLGQVYAEITFLLGNWRYVLPWLVNQVGSLVYLLAVQRAPLSLAVPTANSLAFAFTAITGALVGEPLDAGSIVGIILIAAGTALCCWDKTL